jgi:hypothetical protein
MKAATTLLLSYFFCFYWRLKISVKKCGFRERPEGPVV